MSNDTTIFALSTAAGKAGVAVVRVSGPHASVAVTELAGAAPRPRFASLRPLRHPRSGILLDRALVLWFPGPQSFTGEDAAEFHLHGGRAVVAAVLESLSELPGLRPAEPGEFTRRAFDAGKLDLSAVEGLADMISAETEAQRRQAVRQMEGALWETVTAWRESLLRGLAYYEAQIDFPEEDLQEEAFAGLRDSLAALAGEISAELGKARAGERLREGFQVAILGPPNAGKSSLLNAVARRDVAIVSETAGTTRDVIEVHLDLAGYPVTLADTAGLRVALLEESPEEGGAQKEIEKEGIRRAQARAAAADLKLAVFDASNPAEARDETLGLLDAQSLVILNKTDLSRTRRRPSEFDGHEVLAVSALTGEGLPALLARLEQEVVKGLAPAAAAPVFSRLRHRRALEDCREALVWAGGAALPELAAEDLRIALRALGRITGTVDVEEILDVIFRDFCIGK